MQIKKFYGNDSDYRHLKYSLLFMLKLNDLSESTLKDVNFAIDFNSFVTADKKIHQLVNAHGFYFQDETSLLNTVCFDGTVFNIFFYRLDENNKKFGVKFDFLYGDREVFRSISEQIAKSLRSSIR